MAVETMPRKSVDEVLEEWPEDAREVARTAIEAHGEPDEVTESRLIWLDRGEWREIAATRESWTHNFPFPHQDSLESTTAYKVPLEKVQDLTAFDGSVTVHRTRGTLSATCHDEQANYLALNLAHDIVRGEKSVDEARAAYVKAMAEYRAGMPVPYMDELQFDPDEASADPDTPLTTARELQERAHRIKTLGTPRR